MKKKIFGLFTALVISFLTFSNVQAVEVAKAGDAVTEEGVYNSTRFVAGNRVTKKSNIDGISFVAGNDVTLEGSTEYGFYAGNILNVNENIQKDLFIAGNNITLNSNAVVGRDAYIAGNTVTIKTNITRDLRAAGTLIDLSGITIGGDAYIDANEILLDSETVITGKLSYLSESNVIGLDKAKISSIDVRESDSINIEYNFKTQVIDFVFEVLSAFIILVILFYLVPKSKEKLDNQELSFNNILKNAFIGLLLLIVVPMFAIIVLVTGFLIPLSFITLAIYGISLYLSFLISYYVIGNLLLTKVFSNDNKYLAIIFGIIVVKLVCLIPIVGDIVRLICLLYGLGLIYKFIKSNTSSTLEEK